MADFVAPPGVDKRCRYFNGEFLQEKEFTAEQAYQLDREHRQNRLLHGPGVAEGLTVTSGAPNQVTIGWGTAIDAQGRQLVLLAEGTKVDLPGSLFNDKQGIELYLSYKQDPSDLQQDPDGISDYTRWSEVPELTAVPPGQSYPGTEPPVLLARLSLDGNGNVTVDNTARLYTGARLPGPAADAPTLRSLSSGRVSLASPLTIDGSAAAGEAQPALHVKVPALTPPPPPTPVCALQLDVSSFGTPDNARASQFMLVRDTGSNPVKTCFTVRGDGNVGVGTASPGAKLHVAGDGGQNIDLLVSGQLKSDNNDGGLWVASDRFVGGVNTNQIGIFNGAWRLAVLNNGNVGVGTMNPGSRLHVLGPGGKNVDLLVSGQLKSDNNDGGLWVASDRFVGGLNTNQIGILNGGAWRLVVLPSGHIGIGTDSPENAEDWKKVVDVLGPISTKLSVRTMNVETRIQAHDTGWWGAQPGMIIGTKTSHSLSFGTSGASRMMIDTVGRVGIGVGTANPNANLHLSVPGQKTQILAQRIDVGSFDNVPNRDNSYFMIARDMKGGPGGSPKVVWSVNGAGKHAIGTGNAEAQLHVAGDAYIEQSVFARGKLCYYWESGEVSGWRQVQENALAAVPPDTAVPYPSDIRLKTGVRPVSGALATVGKLRGIRFRWSEAGLDYLTRDTAASVSAGPGATDEQNREVGLAEQRRVREALAGDRMGLVAQDVEAVAPELVFEDEDGYMHIRYQQLAALLVEAVKEQDTRVRSLVAEVAALHQTNAGRTARQPEGE